MRAVEIQALTGPSGVAVVDRDEPVDDGSAVMVEPRAIGVSFPDLLQSKGMYQVRPEPPFVPGLEMAGVVQERSRRLRFRPWRPGLRPAQAAMAESSLQDPMRSSPARGADVGRGPPSS